MKHSLTVLPFLVALLVGVAAMALNVYQVNAWNVGTLEIEPWRKRTSSMARRVRTALAWMRSLLGSRALRLSLAVGLALLAAHLNASAHGHGLVLVGIAGTVAEPTLAEVKTAIESSNRLFGEFKAEHEKRIAALEAGRAVDPLITEKIEKLNKAIDDQSKVNEAFMAVQAKLNRLELSGGNLEGRDKLEAEVRSFNLERRSWHQARGASAPTEVSSEEYKAYAKAFDRYLRVGEKGLTPDEQRAMSVGSDLNGGFLVTPDKTGRVVQKVYETSELRRFADVQMIGTDALEGSADLDEASGGWVSELGTRSDSTTPTVATPWRIPVHELYSQPKASQKLINDSNVDIAAWLEKKVSDKLARLQNTAFVTGTGVGKPRGFASYLGAATADASRAWGIPEYVVSGTNGSWGTDPNAIQKLNSLMGKLKDVYVPGAAFFCTRLTKFSIRNLTDASSAGKFVFIPSFQAGVPDTVLGAPINVLQDMADYTTTDAYALAYGDMKATYQIVDRQGISVLVDPFTSKPYVIFYTTARVGGDVIHFESMKFLKFGTS
jgi:HK97 family phage major capsid protein